MGSVFIGIHKPIVLAYQKAFNLTTLIETGTLRGESTLWAAEHFAHVITAEISDSLYTSNMERFYNRKNIHAYCGDTRDIMRYMISPVTEPALFWLDAHANNSTEVAQSNGWCSVMEEIDAINRYYLVTPHVVLADDARLFTGRNGWPSLDEVSQALLAGKRTVYVVDDVVIGVRSDGELFPFIELPNSDSR